MRTFRLHKLVRDNLITKMQDIGQTVDARVLDDSEYIAALQAKLLEELGEFDASSPSALDELADLQEVIDQLVKLLGADKRQLIVLQAAKTKKSGAFTKRLFVETVTMADDDSWAAYYSADPERFPEVL